MVLVSLDGGVVTKVAQAGALDEVRPWASISKMVVSLAFGVESDWEHQRFDQHVGPPGSTLANLLSHSSGLGLEQDDPVVAVGTQRIYSNYGVDLAVESIIGDNTADNWLRQRVFRPFGMDSAKLEGRPSSGVVGSTNDLADWRWRGCGRTVSRKRPAIASSHLRAPTRRIRSGVSASSHRVPGARSGDSRRQTSLDGDWPATSFGHFGKSGALILLNTDEQIGLVATSTEPFGGWPPSSGRRDERDANVGSWFVSPSNLRVGLDLDGSLESLAIR